MPELRRQLIELAGGRLEVFVGGAVSSPTVCTTHPMDPQTADWDWLAEHCQLVRVNPRGFGASSPALLRRHLTLEQIVADLEAVRMVLGIDRWVYFGGSAGGAVGLLYAVSHPSALSGLAVGLFVPHGVLLLEEYARRGGIPGIAVNMVTKWQRTTSGEWLHSGDPHGEFTIQGWAWCEEVARFDVLERLDQIRVPSLVWCGRHDTLVPAAECTLVGQRIPGARMIVLEQSGHGVEGDDVELFRSTVRAFLSARAES